MSRKEQMTLVVGGTGKTGRRVAERLRALGRAVRIAGRSSTPPFDWANEDTWEPALRGVDAMYLTYFPDLATPGATDAIRALTQRAVASGVRRIVLLSGRGEPQCWPSEEVVRTSGAAWTILRGAWFAQNFSEGQLIDAVRSGVLAFPAGNVAEPFVDIDDVADVAVAALTDDRHTGQIYELSGPRLLTFAEATAIIARASGREVKYVPISMAEYAAVLAQYVPPETVSFLSDLFAYILDGHNGYVSNGVQLALGRPPRDFAEFARDATSAGAWNV